MSDFFKSTRDLSLRSYTEITKSPEVQEELEKCRSAITASAEKGLFYCLVKVTGVGQILEAVSKALSDEGFQVGTMYDKDFGGSLSLNITWTKEK